MLTWPWIAFGLAFATAVVPFGSIELFVIGLVTQRPDIPFAAVGAVVAVGQVLGKLVHYYAALGVLRLPPLLRRAPRPGRAPGRVATWMRAATERAQESPRWMAGIFCVSSVVGLPPFGATVLLAGLTRMRVELFLAIGLVGRFARYCCLAAAPGVFDDVFF
ncbi:hypothetical protein [Saccharothrix longispora]|uniref:hypothetical protein n=1 Tax=Saccharothrix longispora TaxID=33920 RepID=UPI0028FD7614|nr:hypothetical protein [Saccharothrix longispora]MDU0289435.1 hypothetical protein [Saccharothrix longispora]